MRRSFRAIGVVIFISSVFLLNSCVYFNTFYNAKKFYDDAEKTRRSPTDKPTRQQIDLYDKCIERCARVIQDHKKSKYRDDALFLMGKAFLSKDDPQKAINTLEQLIENYPQSSYIDEASLLIGQAYYSLKQQEKALEVFQQTVKNYPHRSFSVRAQFLIGDIYYVQKNYKEAITAYQQTLKMKNKGPLVAECHRQLGECYAALGDNQNAADSFGKAANLFINKEEKIKVKYRQGECLLAIGEYDTAVSIFKELNQLYVNKQDKARCDVQTAWAKIGLGEGMAGWEMLKQIALDFKNSVVAAEANYYMGEYLYQQADYDSAQAFYETANRSASTSDIGLLAAQRKNEVDKLLQLENKAISPNDKAKNLITLAELYLLDQKNEKKAFDYYQTVIDSFPETDYYLWALYAKAFIQETYLKQIDAADSLYGKIIQDYPDSKIADEIRAKFGIPVPVRYMKIPVKSSAPPDTVAADSTKAENQTTAQGRRPRHRATKPDSLQSAPPEGTGKEEVINWPMTTATEDTAKIIIPSNPDSSTMNLIEEKAKDLPNNLPDTTQVNRPVIPNPGAIPDSLTIVVPDTTQSQPDSTNNKTPLEP